VTACPRCVLCALVHCFRGCSGHKFVSADAEPLLCRGRQPAAGTGSAGPGSIGGTAAPPTTPASTSRPRGHSSASSGSPDASADALADQPLLRQRRTASGKRRAPLLGLLHADACTKVGRQHTT
jgi:hypothetical protein